MTPRIRGWHLAATLALAACGEESEEPAQLVVFVDTDAASVGQLSNERSPATAIDIVRIEGLGPNGDVFDGIEVVVTDPSDFPISFGVVATRTKVRMRIRAFSTATTLRSEVSGQVEYEPSPRLAIERVVELDLPESGKKGALVVLSAECFGRPATFEPLTTCVDAGPAASVDTGVIDVDPEVAPTTVIGTSPRALLTPCATEDPERVCISGGVSLLGSDDLGDVLVNPVSPASAPARLVALSPFAIDRQEVTVGRFRQLAGFDAELPTVGVPNTISRNCSWLGPSDASHDTLPLNCIPATSAERVCELLGGRLPTEAEWERAARGPGSANRYPWGDLAPKCCTASFGHEGSTASCGAGLIEPVGSHSPSPACDGMGDITSEGVEDLGGGVSELTTEGPAPYDGECWSVPGIALNPACGSDGASDRVARGGSWGQEGIGTLSALRSVYSALSGSDQVGFRCVYTP
jgi:formylglycine-generating enzyme required for sulfatase activity